MQLKIVSAAGILLTSGLFSQDALTLGGVSYDPLSRSYGMSIHRQLLIPRLPSNMTAIQVADQCKSDGEKCSGPSDTSCCSGLSCSYAGSTGGYICF